MTDIWAAGRSRVASPGRPAFEGKIDFGRSSEEGAWMRNPHKQPPGPGWEPTHAEFQDSIVGREEFLNEVQQQTWTAE